MNERESAFRLYKETFGSSEPFDSRLFDGFFDCCRYITEGDKVASMLFELPCVINTSAGPIDCRYIYAAATAPDCRRKGYMTRLLGESRAKKGAVILRPADPEAAEYYKKRGFLPVTAEARRIGLPFVSVGERLDRLAEGGATGGEFLMMCCGCDPSLLDRLGFAYSME